MSKNKIHIKKENRGKFTKAANKRGMGVQEFARQVLANKERYSPTLIKRANFARNAAKWKKQEGGYSRRGQLQTYFNNELVPYYINKGYSPMKAVDMATGYLKQNYPEAHDELIQGFSINSPTNIMPGNPYNIIPGYTAEAINYLRGKDASLFRPFTSEQQLISQALGVNNPYGALAIDIGAGLVNPGVLPKGINRLGRMRNPFVKNKPDYVIEPSSETIERVRLDNQIKALTEKDVNSYLRNQIDQIDTPEGRKRLKEYLKKSNYQINKGLDISEDDLPVLREDYWDKMVDKYISGLKNIGTVPTNKWSYSHSGQINYPIGSKTSDLFTKTASDHELQHGIQFKSPLHKSLSSSSNIIQPSIKKGESSFVPDFSVQLPYDSYIDKMSFKKNMTPLDRSDKKYMDYVMNSKFDPKEYSNVDALRLEREAFLSELRPFLNTFGYTKNRYDKVTPKMISDLRKDVKKSDEFGSNYARLLNITEDNDWNNHLISDALNKMPAVGLGLYGASQLNKDNMKDNNYGMGGSTVMLSSVMPNELPKLQLKSGGGIPERYKSMGFSKVGQKKKSTRPGKKWMVLAKKGDQYKVVHGGYKGMKDYTQHKDKNRRKKFWSRMGGRDSSKAKDPFSPLYWHKRFGTWQEGGPTYSRFDSLSNIVADDDYSINPSNYKEQSEWLKSYINSPRYREILANEMQVELDSPKLQKEIELRSSNISRYPIKEKQVHPKGFGYLRGVSVGRMPDFMEYYYRGDKVPAGPYDLPKGTYVDPQAKFRDPYVGTHELVHTSTQGLDQMTPFALNLIDEVTPHNTYAEKTNSYDLDTRTGNKFGYVNNPTEVHARLTELKKLMNDYGIVDPRKDKITRDHIIKAFRNKNINKTIDVKDLKEIVPNIGAMEILLNSIAQNNNKSNITAAKKGGYTNTMKYQQGGPLAMNIPSADPIDFTSMVDKARQETIEYLQSPEWAEKSGGYDPSKLISDVRRANVVYDPAKFPKPGKGSQIVRDPNGNITMQLDVQKHMRLGKDPMDLMRHEFGHLGYPNFEPGNETLLDQKLEMIKRNKEHKRLFNDRSHIGDMYRDYVYPFVERTVTGEVTPSNYDSEWSKVRSNLQQLETQYGRKGEYDKADAIKKYYNMEFPRLLKKLQPHEIRQQLIERRKNPNNPRAARLYSPEDLNYLLKTVAQNSTPNNIPIAMMGQHLNMRKQLGGSTYSGKGGAAGISYTPEAAEAGSGFMNKISNAYNKTKDTVVDTYNDLMTPSDFDFEASDRKIRDLEKQMNVLKQDSFNSDMDYVNQYPNDDYSNEIRKRRDFLNPKSSPVDSNVGYLPNIRMKKGGKVPYEVFKARSKYIPNSYSYSEYLKKKEGGLAKSQKSLKDWTNQEWMTSGTYSNKTKGKNKEVKSKGKKRYLPKNAWASMSSGEKAATNRAKAEGNAKGKQFVKQPKEIAKKAARFRMEGGFIREVKDGGKIPKNILESRLKKHMSPSEVNDYLSKYKKGGEIVDYKKVDGGYMVKFN